MKRIKPTVEEIKQLVAKCEDKYQPLWDTFKKDEQFYELDFKNELHLPQGFALDRVITPTSRDVIDIAVDHTNLSYARIFVNKLGKSAAAIESADMLQRLALGLIHRTNVESDISPLRVSPKHFWLHGMSVIKTFWDADNWLDKPAQNKGESENDYATRLDEWREEHPQSLPITIKAINPANIMLDPSYGGKLYGIERYKKLCYDAKKMWPHWTNPNRIDSFADVSYICYYDKFYRCDLVDGEPVLRVKGGVSEHKYGFIPYTVIESGLGNLSADGDPVKRYVGLLRYLYDMLVSESVNFTMCDILIKYETMKGGYISGVDAETIGEIKQEYGKYWPIGTKDVKFVDWERKLVPSEAYVHLALIRDYIAAKAARSLRGQGEQGVRSGADRRLILTEAASAYRYAEDAFANGWSNVLTKCATLVKNVIPGDFNIWARTPANEFDIEIKKSKLKEPFNFYIEFSPISEEDEYRRHDDLIRRLAAGLIDKEYAWERQPDVDVTAMRNRTEKERLRASPVYNQVKDQCLAEMFKQAVIETGLMPAPTPEAGTPQIPSPIPAEGTLPASGRPLVPPIPEKASLGSYEDLMNQFQKLRSQTPMSATQGQGGGGFRK